MRGISQQDKALQRHARDFLKDEERDSIDLDVFVEWILNKELWKPDPKRIKRLLRQDVSHALSEERFSDEHSRKIRRYHFLRQKQDGQQLSLALPIEKIARKDMLLSLQVRKRNLVSRAIQINNDQNYYNNHVNTDEPIQISFNLDKDIKEADAILIPGQNTAADEPKRPSGIYRTSIQPSASLPSRSRL